MNVPAALDVDLGSPVTSEEHGHCPVTDVLRRVGDKWSVLIVVLLGQEPRHYNELHRSVEGISRRILTRTLRNLERDGLVTRTVHPTVPATVEYALSSLGASLLIPISALAEWGVEHGQDIENARGQYDARPPGGNENSADSRAASAAGGELARPPRTVTAR
ncbi:winged helix-turn-helix transcriptional regulator [Streptomyces sp. NPDC058411]|uniref:winged helix-turn-helix transcriptional regulator n=1 Tax=Streptomyces sp. NPDC058411 TaxID=3346485 RepID=UPI003648343F